MIARWPRDIGRYDQRSVGKSHVAGFPKLLVKLHDHDAISSFLFKQAEQDHSLPLGSLIVSACREFGCLRRSVPDRNHSLDPPAMRRHPHTAARLADFRAATPGGRDCQSTPASLRFHPASPSDMRLPLLCAAEFVPGGSAPERRTNSRTRRHSPAFDRRNQPASVRRQTHCRPARQPFFAGPHKNYRLIRTDGQAMRRQCQAARFIAVPGMTFSHS